MLRCGHCERSWKQHQAVLLQRQGDVSWGPGERSAGDQLGGDTLQLPQWVLLGGTECMERGMEDSQMRTLQGQRRRLITEAGKSSATEAQGALRPQESGGGRSKLAKGKRAEEM